MKSIITKRDILDNYNDWIRYDFIVKFEENQIFNCIDLFKKMEDDNTISLQNIRDHIENYTNHERDHEGVTNYLKTILPVEQYSIEYIMNEIYPNNNLENPELRLNFYKITKRA
jgi:hypothetical protein